MTSHHNFIQTDSFSTVLRLFLRQKMCEILQLATCKQQNYFLIYSQIQTANCMILQSSKCYPVNLHSKQHRSCTYHCLEWTCVAQKEVVLQQASLLQHTRYLPHHLWMLPCNYRAFLLVVVLTLSIEGTMCSACAHYYDSTHHARSNHHNSKLNHPLQHSNIPLLPVEVFHWSPAVSSPTCLVEIHPPKVKTQTMLTLFHSSEVMNPTVTNSMASTTSSS